MTPNQVVEHFGGLTKATTAIGLQSHSAVWQWHRRGAVPALRQLQIEALTDGKLKMSKAARKELRL